MKIKLTPEQIQQVIAADSQQLKAKFDADVKALENSYNKDVKALESKYEHYEITISNEQTATTKTRTKIDKAELMHLLTDKKSIKEIAVHFNKPETSIRQKMLNLNLHIKDYK